MNTMVLIATNGLPALQILHAFKELGYKTIVVNSIYETNDLHVKFSDFNVEYNEKLVSRKKMNELLVSTAIKMKIGVIHTGFDSQVWNVELARDCDKHKIILIGSCSSFGRKINIAGSLMVPVLPHKPFNSLQLQFSGDVSFQVFIDVQVLSNLHGDIHIIDQHSTIARDNWHILISESYNPQEEIKINRLQEMKKYAKQLVQQIKFVGISSVRFIIDEKDQYMMHSFVPNIQDTYTVSEASKNIDLIKMQIKLFLEENISYPLRCLNDNDSVHSIQCNVNAENPDFNFIKSIGSIHRLHVPGGVGIRLENIAHEGYVVQNHSSRALSNVVAFDKTRDCAINKLIRGLSEYVIQGIDYNVDYLLEIVKTESFLCGNYT